ncbi:MAG TPA: OsmC family protein [Kofleriaceae bacterium]|nr:OsmC family protein [Kofleriaceae bacterium]
MKHDYAIDLAWEDNTGHGTARQFRAHALGKTGIVGSASPVFGGDRRRHDPEELLLVAASACHMRAYLALCARDRVAVVAYEDAARGQLDASAAVGRFEEIVLAPRVVVARESDRERAAALHEEAHATCYIAASCAFPIRCEPTIVVGEATLPLGRRDLEIVLPHRPGALAELGAAFARAGINVLGGGGFAVGDDARVHFLVADDAAAIARLRADGVNVIAVHAVVTLVLDQDTPGQLGAAARAMATSGGAARGIDMSCVYSDHDNQLVLVVDDPVRASDVAAAWNAR